MWMQEIEELRFENTVVDFSVGPLWTSSAQGVSAYAVPIHDQRSIEVNESHANAINYSSSW